MKQILSLLFFLMPFLGMGGSRFQESGETLSPVNSKSSSLQAKCDSILADANRLYRYEMAAWTAGDIAAKFGLSGSGYCSYGDADTTYSLIFRDDSVLLTTVCFEDACYVDSVARPLSPWEQRFTAMRAKLIDTVVSGNFPVRLYDGFDPNFVLMNQQGGYKLFLMMGTQQQGVIPFGNDYVFFADSAGRITHWRQMHQSLLASDFGQKKLRKKLIDGKISALVHSHLETEPLITPTDICLMRLYGPMYGIDTLKVYSPALRTYFVYSASGNTIAVVDAK